MHERSLVGPRTYGQRSTKLFHALFDSNKTQTGPRTASVESDTVIAYRQRYRFVCALHRDLNRGRCGMTGTIRQRFLNYTVKARSAFISEAIEVPLNFQLYWCTRSPRQFGGLPPDGGHNS